jgi:hypothetical protein
VTPPDEPTTIDRSRLDVRSLLHPFERSRLTLALCAIAIVFGVAAMVVARAGGGGALLGIVPGLAILGTSVWWLLQVHRAHLLGQAVHVTEHSLPELQKVVDEVRQRLDYRRRVDVYVTAKAASPSAMVTYLGTRILLLEGSLIADLQEEDRQPQLTFLVASYFGALKAKHERLYPVEIALTAFSSLKFLNLFLYPYFRAVTYSGDQIGHACSGDIRQTVAMMNRLLVGKELTPSLATKGVLDQAATVRHRVLPRLAQLFSGVPHLTNRYLNMLFFIQKTDPSAVDAFRAELDAETDRRLGAELAVSPHTRPTGGRRRAAFEASAVLFAAAVLLGSFLVIRENGPEAPPETSTSEVTSPPTTEPAPPTTEPAPPTTELTPVLALLAHVPASTRSHCMDLEEPSAFFRAGLEAAVACSPPTTAAPGRVVYFQYGTVAAMNRIFNRIAASFTGGDCTAPSQRGT